ncbi:DUF255 domain-containing protein [Membranicola marinus]|uniref:DUF255 domain-containing protein n=1 Tax=Membranihabitans marinus TaxID=1227546 RepID=A0A953HU71_9BACT|nr:thioredoxin domain-containing protein [Membranihabitans marinus]MBY5956521.1 DUF255 domain-containing protein [Membranihabitans marinus]
MKSILFTLFIIGFSTQLFGQIEFRDGTWDDLLEMSKAEDKLIFVDAYAVWCGPCKRMSKEVFTQASVGDFFNENFINAKIDMEKGEGPSIQRKYGVTAYPTLLFITPDGDLLHKARGYQPADRLINNGKIALSKTNKADEFATRYDEGERDPAFVLEYIQQLNKADKPTESIALQYFQEQKEVEVPLKARIAFEALKNMDSQLLQYVMEGKATIKENYDQSVIDEKLVAAAESTINTAVEFNAPSVFHQMVSSLEQMELSPALLQSVERKYYAQTEDESAFLESIKTSLESESADPGALAMEIYQAFPNSKSMLEYGREIFDRNFAKNMTVENYVTGLSLAIGLEDFVYMEQIFETMKMKPNPNPQEKRQVEALYQKAKSFLTRQLKPQGN